ncbi:MAG: hypothetical protein RBR32_13085 [Bacteroidales bacterium]|jgi:hypothetical protein|nr:hypothetical protein [Bacteroidales bacterium]
MTNWTKEDDLTTKYGSGQRGYELTTMDGRTLTTQSGIMLTREGVTSAYEGEVDSKDRYIPFGVGLKVASEDFTWMLTEDRVRLIHSKTPWAGVGDIVTNYIKVEDE